MKFKLLLFCLIAPYVIHTVQCTNLPVYSTDLILSKIVEGFQLENIEDLGINNTECVSQIVHLLGNPKLLWQMIDATSKVPAGVLYSNNKFVGNYDECIKIEDNSGDVRLLGKHCFPGVVIPIALLEILEIFKDIPLADFGKKPKDQIHSGVCIPDKCSFKNDLAPVILQKFPALAVIPNVTDLFVDVCSTKETGTDFSALDISVLTVFSIILFLIVVSTSYDIVLYIMDKNPIHPITVAFSVYTNGRKLFFISNGSKEQMQMFHGLKFISMMWIIAGHGFSAWALAYNPSNEKFMNSWLTKRVSQYIGVAPIAVDTFFYLSGFLLAYGYLKSEKPMALAKQVMSIPYMYLHRYLRLTPALVMIYLVTISTFKYLGSGPHWDSAYQMLRKPCIDKWWSVFLYTQNYYNFDDLCMTQTWYLSADMQMFVLSPLVLIPVSLYIRRYFKRVMIGLMALNVVAVFVPMIIKLCNEEYPYSNAYDTHSRLCNFTIGITMGAYMRINLDKPFKLSKTWNLALWCLALGDMLMVFLIYGEVFVHPSFKGDTIFFTFMRPFWCAGLCWIVYSCYHGHGGIINWLLTASIFQIGSRLTYSMYLIHGTLIVAKALTSENLVFFSDFNEYYLWCGHLVTSVVLAVGWTLAFESPMITIEKLIFGGAAPKPKPKVEN